MKTKEELKALKMEIETMNKKLAELNDEELAQVSGGSDLPDGMVILSFSSTRDNLLNDLTSRAIQYRVRNLREMQGEFIEKLNAIMQGQTIVTLDDIYSYLVFIYEDNDGSAFNHIYHPGSLQVFKVGG